MTRLNERLNKATDILTSRSNNIKTLASLSDCELYTYFEGANLAQLDLTGQDLTALSFYQTDLRGSRLPVDQIDPGALNQALVDSKYSYLKDDFDISIIELANLDRFFGGNVFIVFRARYIELVAEKVRMYYYELAQRAQIHQKTLQSARSGRAVLWSTARGICRALNASVNPNSDQVHLLKNPAMYFTQQVAYGRYRRMQWQPQLQKFVFADERLNYDQAFGSQFNLAL